MADIDAIVRSVRTVAVLGAHPDAARPGHQIPKVLHEHGLRIIPVNAKCEGEQLFGEPYRTSLAEIREPVDVVDVFRAGEALPQHLDDILAMDPRPPVVWFQLGIHNDEVKARLEAEGFTVVQDHCLKVEWLRANGS